MREVLRYWDRARIRAAEPLDATPAPRNVSLPDADAGGVPGYVPASGPAATSSSARGQDTAARVDDPRYPRAIFDAGEVSDWQAAPNTTNGKVFARMRGIGPYECSATVVNSPTGSVVFTAGHCVAEAPNRRATKFIFIPSYRQKERSFGAWAYERILVPDQWAERGNFNFDFAAVVLGPRNGTPVEEVTGGRGIAWNLTRRRTYTAFGYPVNRAKGQRMWYCTSGFLRRDPRPFGGGPIPSGIGCDMGAGASGGGWIVEGGLLNSVSSFGYGRRSDILYGPYFGDMARRIYKTASQTVAL